MSLKMRYDRASVVLDESEDSSPLVCTKEFLEACRTNASGEELSRILMESQPTSPITSDCAMPEE